MNTYIAYSSMLRLNPNNTLLSGEKHTQYFSAVSELPYFSITLWSIWIMLIVQLRVQAVRCLFCKFMDSL
jgi:hypothetical protein